jgi:hypothetical protein
MSRVDEGARIGAEAVAEPGSAPGRGKRRNRLTLIVGLAVALLVAGVLSYYASAQPDGLEAVAERSGIAQAAQDHPLADSPLADYGVSGVESARISGGLAGVIGVVLTFVLTTGAFLLVARRRPQADPTAATERVDVAPDRAADVEVR